MKKLEILSSLNEKQREAVTNTKGPLLVLAGAGSGKTRAVIFRVAWLINVEKVPAWKIMVVTFTNKAARELKDRLDNLFDDKSHAVWVGTFHSICLRIIRYEIKYLPKYTAEFSIYDRDDQQSVLRKIYKVLDIDKTLYPYRTILSLISKFKSQQINIENFFEHYDYTKQNKVVFSIFEAYERYLGANNAMDFDDILLNTVNLFENHTDVLEKYQMQLQYIMVDEYQDTNLVQFKFINMLADKFKNICVVGDDDQSIYGWRGANVQNILSFEQDYKNVKTIKLEQNYRSTSSILNLANNIIIHNKNRHLKHLWTDNESEKIPVLISHDSEYEEARYIAEEIVDLYGKGTRFAETVVLYRTNAQSRVLEQAFTKYQIPYVVVGGLNFYQRSEIKDMIAWLRVIANPYDNESLLRVINLPPRGLGATTISMLLEHAIMNDTPLYHVCSEIDKMPKIHKKQRNTIKDFYHNIQLWKEKMQSDEISSIIKEIIKTYDLEAYYKKIEDTKESTKLENIGEFVAAATDFSERYFEDHQESADIAQFLQFLSLQTDLDNADKKSNTDAVRLMTMHNAKGLEFDYVFIAGLEQGLLPHMFSCGDNQELEEERRLFYVAVTRARKQVFLNYAHARRKMDSYQMSMPSEFLREIDTNLYETIKASYWQPHIQRKPEYKAEYTKPSISVITENSKFFKIGQKIMHQDYGKGVILSVDGVGKDAKLSISFNNGNLKKINGAWVEIIDE